MTQPTDHPSAFPSAIGSERFRLARLARDAALQVPGVLGTDTGAMGLFITVGGGERLDGVTCVTARQGGYDVSLRLHCGSVPLPGLTERVETAVRQVAAEHQIALTGLSVLITDTVEPELR